MMTGRDVVIGRGVLIIGLVSVIFAIMVGYATVHAKRNDRCGEIVAQVIDAGRGDGIADAQESLRIAARPARP
jgi:hypothetical protein